MMAKGETQKGIGAKKKDEFVQENFLMKKKRKVMEVSSFVHVPGASGQIILQANKHLLDTLCTLIEEQQNFKDWDKMQERIKTCLWQLISFYRQKRRNHLTTLSPGSNTVIRQNAWMTARVLFPGLVLWANDEGNKKTRLYKSMERTLQKENYTTIPPDRIAAFIIRTNMNNQGGQYAGFTKKDPCVDPYRFQQRLNQLQPFWSGYYFNKGHSKFDIFKMKREELIIPPGIGFLIKAILDGASWQVDSCIPKDPILLQVSV